MKKYAFIFLLISKIVATQGSDFIDNKKSYYVDYLCAISEEQFFIQYEYSDNETQEHNIKMETAARKIIAHLIGSEKETLESLMIKLNEEHVMLLATDPIIEFYQGSLFFPSITLNLKNYYTRHKNMSLIDIKKPHVPTRRSWFYGIKTFFSSASESSQGTTEDSSDTDPLVKKTNRRDS